VLRAARFALLALTVFLLIGAATASAQPRMPIGFFDDPTFRWSADRMDNLQRASTDGASIIHTTASWAALAPTRPADASNGDDPAYKLADLDELVQRSSSFGMRVMINITGTPKWANGNQKPNVMPKKVGDLQVFAHMLAARRLDRASLRELLIPLVPAAVIALALIVAQPDLGQTVSLGIILLGLLWYAGLPLRVFLTSLLAVIASAAVLAVSEGYRSTRVQSWLNPGADAQGSGYQARQARFALANGGVFGDGLGQGTAKWNYLPNAHNDFIFAIIGEELGFVGAVGLLCLFGLFAYTGMRIARRSADPFLRLLTATATLWVLGQVFINVGYVVGLLPVTGLQLPLISAGGTSTATTLLIIGIMANAARHEPEAVATLRAGREDRVNRLLRLPLPEPYVPTRTEALRDRLRTRPDAAPAKARRPARKDKADRKPVADKKRKPQPVDRQVRRSGHHGGGQRSARSGRQGAGQRNQGRRAHTLEGQRHG